VEYRSKLAEKLARSKNRPSNSQMSIAILPRERRERERERHYIGSNKKIRHAAANALLAAGRAAVEVDGKAKENRAIIARLGGKRRVFMEGYRA